jgi:hypothetical protein
MDPRTSTGSSDRRIDFIVAGAQKAGTTTLDVVLRQHPQVQLPIFKELHFFDRRQFFPPDGPPDYEAYHRHWDWGRTGVLRGEVSPSYLGLPVARERMARYSADLRVICILRNPVSRAYSAWNHWVRRGGERLSFHEALLAEDSRLADRAARGLDGYGGYGYRSLSEYASQLEALWRLIPRERTIAVQLEALQRNPDETMRRITDFLGIAPHRFGSIGRRNARFKFGDMHPDTSRWLIERLEPEIARIEESLGWDCSSWRKPKGSQRLWAVGETVRRAALPFSFVKPPLERLRARIGAWRRTRAGLA